jgi:dethiobiotin synthetase
MPWMCLDDCGATAAQIAAQIAQLATPGVFSAAAFEDYDLGADGTVTKTRARTRVSGAIKALGLPCLLVTGTYLGAISHTLTALAAMRAEGCAPRAIAVSESLGSSVSLADTMAELAAFAPGVAVGVIRRNERDFAALARACGLAA